MKFEIFWADKKAQKQFDSLSPFVKNRITKAIKDLLSEPKPQNSKKLSGNLKGVWRLRCGDYRILYDIDEKSKKVILLNIGHRRNIYR